MNDRDVTVEVDERSHLAPEGMTLSALLVSAGVWAVRKHPITGTPRGPFCGMGICYECEVTVDGQPGIRSCLTRVTAGMRVATGE